MSKAFGRWVIFCGSASLGADRLRLGLAALAAPSTTGLGEEEARALHADLGRAIEHAWGVVRVKCGWISTCHANGNTTCSCGTFMCREHAKEHAAVVGHGHGIWDVDSKESVP